MNKVALRGLGSRKLRAFVTTLAVFLGVAFIAGSYVLTDTINASFDDIFEQAYKGTDVSISPTTSGSGDDVVPPAFDAGLLEKVRQVEGVEAAVGGIFSVGRFVDSDGEPLVNSFAPNFITSTAPKRFETLTYVEGRKPRTQSEASLDTSTAERAGLEIGDTLRIVGEREVTDYRLVGLQRLGETSSGGAGTAQLTLPEAQRITNKQGKLDGISVAAAEGEDTQELKGRIDAIAPPAVLVETGEEAADRSSKEIAEDLGFFKVILLVFGGVALFVGSFLIFNTFSITVAQRIRELGMLRTLGATRFQVLRSMVLEALVIGAVGSLLGVAGGVAFAALFNAIFKAFGIDLPNTGTVVATRTVVVALVVGLLVTLASALVPALRATRVSPMAALREAELPESRKRGRIYAAVAILLSALGVVLTCIGLFGGAEGSNAAALVGGGAVAVLLGVSLFSPQLVRPLASAAGKPLERLRGLTGRLARENAMRKPGRTAVTASALMIGLAVVVFVTVFAAGISSSVGKAIDRNFQGDVVLQNVDGFSPIPKKAGAEARGIEGVRTVSSLSFSNGRVKGQDVRVSGADPATAGEVLSLDWTEGSPSTLARLGQADAVVDDAWAKTEKVDVGDRVTVRTPTERNVTYTVRGKIKDNADMLGNLLISERSLQSLYGNPAPSLTLVRLADGADADGVQKQIAQSLDRNFPTVDVLNQAELKDKQEEQIQQVVALFYVLLAFAVLVSLLGIVTTLALSIHERTRELGMLRAVGMSRKQVRRMIRYEAVITALIGAVLGTVLGVIFAALVSRPLADEGFELAFPIGTLLVLLLLAALAGVLAAILPARRAAKLDVLKALAYE